MRSTKQFYTSKGSTQVGLYSFVFTKRISIFAIIFLFISFLVQPFHQALANEAALEEPAETVLPDEVAEQLPDAVDSEPEVTETEEVQVADEEEIIEETPNETVYTTNEDEEVINEDSTNSEEETGSDESNTTTDETTGGGESSDGDQTASTTDETQTDDTASSTEETGTNSGGGSSGGGVDTSASSTDATTDTASSTPPSNTGTTTATSTDDGTGTSTDNTGDTTNDDSDTTNQDNDTTDDSSSNDDNDTTTDDDLIDDQAIQDGLNELVDEVVDGVVNITRQLVTEENYYQFSRQSCVAVGDGTYHCTTDEPQAIDPDSAVYAEPDMEGDMEIYMRTSKGDVKQLSDNSYDDTSPDSDLASMRVVWQRLIDGRYQVISYDLVEREETQLTFSRNNSMEPKVAKEGIVWQAWDGTDWEIMYFDGQFTEQITDNDGIQDVTPVIEDGYILWSVLGGEESEARVYSLESGERMTITGHEGGTVANPRFVLVYDTKFENGDIITVGFDPVTGLAQPVSAQPAELPFDIPEPDPIGEIRALIQNKSTSTENEIVSVAAPDDTDDLDLASTTATSTDTLSLDNVGVDDDGEIALPVEEVDLELDENDLVITDTASSTEAAVNDELWVPNLTDSTSTTTATSTQS